MATCETCRFFVAGDWEPSYQHATSTMRCTVGRCRRNPPAAMVGAKDAWPAVSAGSWCGEHQRAGSSRIQVRPMTAADDFSTEDG